MKLALSTLCENPFHRTGLTTFFREFVEHSLAADNDLSWVVFADRHAEWPASNPRLTVNRWFPGNQRMARRLLADHFLVPAAARLAGADALVTIGFVPLLKALPVAMHLLAFASPDRDASLRGRYRDWMRSRGLRAADLIVTNSNWSAARILDLDPACRERLFVSYEGLQHNLFHPVGPSREPERLNASFGLRPGYLLWVSNFYSYKQPELLLRAYSLLSEEDRRMAPLVMAGGSWAGGAEALRLLAGDLGIDDDVHVLGWVEDHALPLLYRNARAFALASREETFGRCVLEAMACGVVCVLNDIPTLREVTASHAVFADFRDAPAAALALQTALFDREARERLRAPALKRAAHFRFETLAAERVAAIAAILPQANGARAVASRPL